MATLKLQSNGPLYNNTVIWYSEEGTWPLSPPMPLLAVLNVSLCNSPSINGQCTNFNLMWHYNSLWTLKRYSNIIYIDFISHNYAPVHKTSSFISNYS